MVPLASPSIITTLAEDTVSTSLFFATAKHVTTISLSTPSKFSNTTSLLSPLSSCCSSAHLLLGWLFLDLNHPFHIQLEEMYIIYTHQQHCNRPIFKIQTSPRCYSRTNWNLIITKKSHLLSLCYFINNEQIAAYFIFSKISISGR